MTSYRHLSGQVQKAAKITKLRELKDVVGQPELLHRLRFLLAVCGGRAGLVKATPATTRNGPSRRPANQGGRGGGGLLRVTYPMTGPPVPFSQIAKLLPDHKHQLVPFEGNEP